jgi:hypothetical protein
VPDPVAERVRVGVPQALVVAAAEEAGPGGRCRCTGGGGCQAAPVSTAPSLLLVTSMPGISWWPPAFTFVDSPLLASIALSMFDEHVHAPWLPGGPMKTASRRHVRRARGTPPTWRDSRAARHCQTPQTDPSPVPQVVASRARKIERRQNGHIWTSNPYTTSGEATWRRTTICW